ncbi:MAG: hypothetical protein P8176_09395 [Gammaproteobacteria bacterium]
MNNDNKKTPLAPHIECDNDLSHTPTVIRAIDNTLRGLGILRGEALLDSNGKCLKTYTAPQTGLILISRRAPPIHGRAIHRRNGHQLGPNW